MTDATTPDRWHQKISAADGFKFAGIVFFGGGAWVTVVLTGQGNAEDIAQLTAEVAKLEMTIDANDAATDLRVRSLENNAARADERFTNILQLLARIDGRLERIEEKP